MITQKSLRTWFQVLAFGLFIFQMQESIRKYFYGPTAYVKSQKHISQTQVNILEKKFNHVNNLQEMYKSLLNSNL